MNLRLSDTARRFYAGDLVYLKSGSPPLTVSHWAVNPRLVPVEWFDGATLKRDLLDPECVTATNPAVPAA